MILLIFIPLTPGVRYTYIPKQTCSFLLHVCCLSMYDPFVDARLKRLLVKLICINSVKALQILSQLFN